MTVLARLGSGHVDNLARAALDHNMPDNGANRHPVNKSRILGLFV